MGVLVPLSATILALSYFFPCYCPLLISIFLVPIFIKVYFCQTLDLIDWALSGYLWGVCFFSLHWIFVVSALKTYTTFSWCMITYLFFILYASLWSALWFLCSGLGVRIVPRSFSWVIGTWIYFLWLERYALIPLGFPGGYPFANPVCLLAYSGQNTILFSLLGSPFLLFICISLQMIAVILIKKRTVYGSIFLYILCIAWWLRIEETESCTVYPITCVSPPTKSYISYLDCAQELTAPLINTLIHKPHTQIVSTPEGAFPYPLNVYPEIISMWTDNALHERAHLLVGAYYQEGDRLYNCVYHLYQRRIIQIYRKKTLMPFTESSFTSEVSETTNKNTFSFPTSLELTVAICSDFYLAPAQYKDAKILLLVVNDTWFMPYMQYILYLYASAFTRQHNIALVYSSYSCYTTK